MHNKVAFVAAASKGIGFAIANELCSRGLSVVIASRSADNLRHASSTIQGVQPKALIDCCIMDLEDEHSVRSGLENVIRKFGRLDVLVTNSGGLGHGAVSDFDASRWIQALTNKWWSLFWMLSVAVPVMREKSHGAVLNIGSIYSKEPHNGYLLSNSVRLLSSAFLKSLSDEVAADGIRVNQLLCGFVYTERLASHFRDVARLRSITSDAAEAATKNSIPMKRFADPAEIGKTAAFLLSDDASYITGQSLVVDGGLIRTAL